MNPLTPSSRTYHLWVLFALWAAVQAVLYWEFGVKIMADSVRYMDNGIAIVNGEAFGHYDAGYLSYILIVGSVLNFAHEPGLIVCLQVIVSAFALWCLYQVATQISQNSRVGFLTCLLYILWFRLSMWNFYILTESLFISCTMITFWSLLNMDSVRKALVFLPLWIFTIFLRPNGLALLAALICFFYLMFRKKDKRIARAILGAAILLFPVVLWILNQKIDAYNFVRYYYMSGEIISEYKGVLIHPTTPLTLPMEDGAPLIQWLQFIVYNPIFFLKLCFAKLFFFFTHVRPYYSVWNNAFIVLTLVPSYILMAIGLKHASCEPRFKALVILSIVFHAAIVMLYIEDWDGRFLLPLLPLVFIFTAIGLFKIIERIGWGNTRGYGKTN